MSNIIIEHVEFKNFLSTGNTPIRIYCNKSPTTLITGSNGAGKTTLADAITFGLFGKSYRDTNKPKLVNDKINKNCLVKIKFSVSGVSYDIIRGIKPEIFEIYKNGNILNQDAAIKDTQAYLQSEILGFTYEAFVNTCIMSTVNFKPFFQLRAYERRLLVEQLLNLETFAKMAKIAKVDRVTIDTTLNDIYNKIQRFTGELSGLNNAVKSLEKINNSSKESAKTEYDNIIADLKDIKSEYDNLQIQLTELNKIKDFVNLDISVNNQTIRNLESDITYARNTIKSTKSKITNISNIDVCTLCSQNVAHEHKENIINMYNIDIDKLSEELNIKTAQLIDIQKKNNELKSKIQHNTIQNIEKRLQEIKIYINTSRNRLSHLDTIIKTDTNSYVDEYNKLTDNIRDVTIKRDAQNIDLELYDNQRFINNEMLELLKDSGIKAVIISEYIPILVNYVNYYLELMNFNLKINMDSEFKETLYDSNGESKLIYHNLSQGEKQRLDLAMSFAWRELAKNKGSIDCNLLIIDEMLDASLDAVGTDDVLNILDRIVNTNVFIVSHKNFLDDKVRSIIKLEKVNGFSKIT